MRATFLPQISLFALLENEKFCQSENGRVGVELTQPSLLNYFQTHFGVFMSVLISNKSLNF